MKWLATPSLDVLCVLASTSSLVWLCTEVVRRHPVNHAGFSPWLLLIIPSVALAIDLGRTMLERRTRRMSTIIVASWALTGAALIVTDRCNVLVEYETWIQRGMPAAWQIQTEATDRTSTAPKP